MKNPLSAFSRKNRDQDRMPTTYEPTDFGGLKFLQDLLQAVSSQQAGLSASSNEIRGTATLLNEKSSASITAAEQAATNHEEADRRANEANTAVDIAKGKTRNAANAESEAKRELGRKKDDLANAERLFPCVQQDFDRTQSAKNEAYNKVNDKQAARDTANNAVIAATAEQSALKITYDTLKKLADSQTVEAVKAELTTQAGQANDALTAADRKLNDAKTALNTAESELGLAESDANRANDSFAEHERIFNLANGKVSDAKTAVQNAEFALAEAENALKAAEREESDAEKAAVRAAVELELAQIRADGAAEKRDILEQLAGFGTYHAALQEQFFGVLDIIRANASTVEQHILSIEGAYDEAKAAYEQEKAEREAREGTINGMRSDRFQSDYFVEPASYNGGGRPALPGPGQQRFLPGTTDVLIVPTITLKSIRDKK